MLTRAPDPSSFLPPPYAKCVFRCIFRTYSAFTV